MNLRSLPTRRRTLPAGRGFTLLEVTVALAIVGMLALGLFASLTVAFKARQMATRNLNNIRQARIAMEMIGRDLQSALPPTGILAGAFIATPNEAGFELDSLDFFNTSSPGPVAMGAADVQRVALLVMSADEASQQPAENEADVIDPRDTGTRLQPQASASASGHQVLVRRVTRRLMAQVTPEPSNQIVVRNVRSFRVRLYDGSTWVDTWDSTTMDNTLPYAVEVTLVIDPIIDETDSRTSDQPFTLMRVFPILAASEPTGTSAGQVASASQGVR